MNFSGPSSFALTAQSLLVADVIDANFGARIILDRFIARYVERTKNRHLAVIRFARLDRFERRERVPHLRRRRRLDQQILKIRISPSRAAGPRPGMRKINHDAFESVAGDPPLIG